MSKTGAGRAAPDTWPYAVRMSRVRYKNIYWVSGGESCPGVILCVRPIQETGREPAPLIFAAAMAVTLEMQDICGSVCIDKG